MIAEAVPVAQRLAVGAIVKGPLVMALPQLPLIGVGAALNVAVTVQAAAMAPVV